jgi:hypothetical protein
MMTGKQHAVMWMGLLLIVLRLFTTSQWASLKALFQSGEPRASGGSGGGGGGGGGIPFPLPGSGPFPGLPIEPIITLSKVKKKKPGTAIPATAAQPNMPAFARTDGQMWVRQPDGSVSPAATNAGSPRIPMIRGIQL